jgi:serine/threonine protein kinase
MFHRNKRFISVNTANKQFHERIIDSVGGSFAQIYNCNVDGWVCAVKELDAVTSEFPDLREKLESEIALLEALPYHKNIVRYLFHEEVDNKITLFMTKYSCSLRNAIQTKAKLKRKFTPVEIARLKKIFIFFF